MSDEHYNLELLHFNSQSSFSTREPRAVEGHDEQYLLLNEEIDNDAQIRSPESAISSRSTYTVKRKPVSSMHSSEIDIDPSSETRWNKDNYNITAQESPRTYFNLHPRSKLRRKFFAWSDWWAFELLALATSLVSTMALIAILIHINGKTIQSWPLGITSNGVVAVLSTNTRASLAASVAGALSQGTWIWFSESSQTKKGTHRDLKDLEVFAAAPKSSWSSLLLLWTLRKHRPQLVSIGALLTILFLAFDAFTQQVLGFETRLDNGTSSGYDVPRCVNYSPSFADTTAPSDITSVQIQDYSLLSAVYSSILGTSVAPLSATCSTGNCTWPIIPTLAWCGECSAPSFIPSCQNTTTPTCNYTTDPLTYWIGDSNATANNFSIGAPNASVTNAFQTFPHILGTDTGGSVTRAIDFGVVYMPWTSNTTLQDALAQNYTYRDCSLSLCLQAYNISVKYGAQIQNTVQSYTGPNGSTGFYDLQTQFLNEANLTSEPGYNIAPGEQFYYNFTTLSYIAQQIQSVFIGEVSISEGMWSDDPGVNHVFTNVEYSSNVIGAMWKASSDLDTWIENVALAMTNSIRTASAADANPFYEGTVFQNAIFVKVRWVWLIFPVSLLLLSLLFLLVSIWQTRQSNVPVWKDNALALLLLRADENIKKKSKGQMESQSGLERVAEDVKVVLQAEEGVWGFKSA